MLLKNIVTSDELLLLHAVSSRMKLDAKTLKRLLNLEKGLIGERWFLEWLLRLGWNVMVIPDLKTKINHSSVQVDTIVIAGNTVYLFEVKNYEGEYYFEEGRFFFCNGEEYNSPLKQIEKIELAIRQLLRSWGSNFRIEYYVVFVNPSMGLTQMRRTDPIIMPHQLDRRFSTFRKNAPYATAADRRMGERLVGLHDQSLSFIDIPDYDVTAMGQGMRCRGCNGLDTVIVRRKCLCRTCGRIEPMHTSILDAAKDYRLIHRVNKINVPDIEEFCGGMVSQKSIRTALNKEYDHIAKSNYSYYIPKQQLSPEWATSASLI